MTGETESRGDRGRPRQKAAVIAPYLASHGGAPSPSRDPASRLSEAVGLAEALCLDVVLRETVRLSGVRPATLVGEGKTAELGARIADAAAGLAIIDHALTPVQQRNLEVAWGVKVLDRSGVILEIFGDRARTKEGRLQVELAHLSYQKSRLVRSWTNLDRQRGGFGFLGGPGETQIEADRRLIGERIAAIRAELETVQRTRALHRQSRRRIPYPAIALVGYTNAGKSTLFNRLTGAGVVAQDMLFATLDPTMREVRLPAGDRAILSDTVGFISDLPTTLIAAFRATLEEVTEADVILHVRDISASHTEAERGDVTAVLDELGLGASGKNTPLIEVWNKADLLEPEAREAMRRAASRNTPPAVLASAMSGEGAADILRAVQDVLHRAYVLRRITIAPTDGALQHWVYENGCVLEREIAEDGAVRMLVRLAPANAARLDAAARIG
ncbi:MAG: GTPase HflX [Hyphomicrobiales bacterium]|nr:GTPase HflX [Hyphomicrobiales bacterium]